MGTKSLDNQGAKWGLHPLIHTFDRTQSGTRYSYFSTLHRFGQLTPTNRTHFLAWPNHQIGLALGAFDSVEFDSFDIVRVEASHLHHSLLFHDRADLPFHLHGSLPVFCDLM